MEKQFTEIKLSDIPGEAAWLAYNGHHVEFVREVSGFIVAVVEATEAVEDCLAEFQAGPTVELLNFLAVQRRERGKMLDLRNGRIRRLNGNGDVANGNFR